MNTTLLKLRVWTKAILFLLLLLYVFFFVVANWESQAAVWLFFGHTYTMPVLVILLLTFLLGGLVMVLVRTTYHTLAQIRTLKQRRRTDELEREVAEMRSRSATPPLHTRPPA